MLNILLGTKLRTTGGTSLSHFTYAYDNDDNITAVTDMVDATKSMAYGYDGYGRLTGYARTGEPSQANTYNGLDDRVAVTSGGTTRRYVFDADGRVMGEYGTSATDVIAEFIWMNPQVGDGGSFGGDDGVGGYAPLAVASGPVATPTLLWVHGNHLGVPQVYTTSSGALASPGAWQIPGFPGQSRTLADLYYNRYRDYDPTTGRYIQADPIGLAGDTNPYVYAGANPVTGIDPDGLSAAAIGGAIGRFASRATPAGRIGWMIGAVARVLVNQINVQPSVSRPKELTRLEERQFDRYCVNSQDPCKALRLAADQAIENARIKRMAMLNDKGGMFGHVGWATHAADLAGRLANIHAMIALGEKMGCPMSDQRRKLREISVPNSPSSKG